MRLKTYTVGQGCEKCVCIIGDFYTCKNPDCSQYCPTISRKQGMFGGVHRTPGNIMVFGRYSKQNDLFKFTRAKELIGMTARTKLLPSKTLKYAACWTGDIEVIPTNNKADEVKIVNVTGEIEVNYYLMDPKGNWAKANKVDKIS